MSGLVEYLESGCLIADGRGDLWLGVGLPERSDRPIPNSLAIYSPDFFLDDSQPWHCFMRRERVPAAKLVQKFQSAGADGLGLGEAGASWEKDCTSPSQAVFAQLFQMVQKQLTAQIFKKVVPVIFERAPLAMTEERRRVFLAQVLSYVEVWPLYVYGLWDRTRGILGATPEVLFAQDESEGFRTMALAGTRLKALSSLLPKLLDDNKERTEHQAVIDGICQALRDFENLQVGATTEFELPTLYHLFTPIKFSAPGDAKISTASDSSSDQSGKYEAHFRLFNQLIECLHPTPALGTFPRAHGLELLREMQTASGQIRNRFGAPFGAIFPTGEMLCYVAIRNMEWDAQECRIGAGCGLVSASQLDREWQEVLGKIRSTKTALGLLL